MPPPPEFRGGGGLEISQMTFFQGAGSSEFLGGPVFQGGPSSVRGGGGGGLPLFVISHALLY